MPAQMLQRLNSRDVLRSLPHADDALALSIKRERLRRSERERNAWQDHGRHPQYMAPPLAPKSLAPLNRSKAVAATELLQRIESIEIVDVAKKDDGKNYYTIHVYLQHDQSRIPTNQGRNRRALHPHHSHSHSHCHKAKPEREPHAAEPDYIVHRRFSDFEKLRHDLLDAVQSPHGHFCHFCDRYLMLLLFSATQPTVVTKTFLCSTKMRAKMLDKFTHNLVAEFQQNRPRCQFPCHGNTSLPVLLYDFLVKDLEVDNTESAIDSDLDPAQTETH